jgi:pimeloyl-ACP methyl ester carboxylesterase
LIVHRAGDMSLSIEHGRYIAEHIPGAEFVELPGRTHGWVESPELIDEIERFVGDLQREEAAFDRVLATVLSPTSSRRPRRPPGAEPLARGRERHGR